VAAPDANIIDLSSDDDEPRHRSHRHPTKLVLMSVMILENTVLLKEAMKISDHCTALLLVPQVVAMDALGN
jgi:hypothetical protein